MVVFLSFFFFLPFSRAIINFNQQACCWLTKEKTKSQNNWTRLGALTACKNKTLFLFSEYTASFTTLPLGWAFALLNKMLLDADQKVARPWEGKKKGIPMFFREKKQWLCFWFVWRKKKEHAICLERHDIPSVAGDTTYSLLWLLLLLFFSPGKNTEKRSRYRWILLLNKLHF